MFAKPCTASLLALLLLPASGIAQTEQPSATRFGIGFQASFPAWGFSGVADLSDNIALQGIVGFVGDLKMYGGRGIVRLSKAPYWNTYGYAMGGVWTYKGFKVATSGDPFFWGLEETTESVPGFGAGVGIEYDWRAWNSNLPPVAGNLELGFGRVAFDEVDYNFSTLMLGGGLHFRF